jgi:hypothetical protein
MQNELTESVQASIRPGEMKDVMYPGETNVCKQAYPSIVNTRFIQQFTNLGSGSSQFILSPNGGISDIVLQMATPLQGAGGTTYANAALPTGWGYALINRVSVRYGSSAQYFWSGMQVYLQNVLDAETDSKATNIANQGGQALAGVNTPTGSPAGCSGATAFVYLKLPHNSCRAAGKPLPFPSDLLVQPIVVTVELFSLQSIMINQAAATLLTTTPTTLASASLQVKQEMLTDSSDQLARRVDMNSHALTFPLPYFCQQETQIAIAGAGAQSVNLTGFRAGEVKQIVLWFSPNSAGGQAGAQTLGSGNYQPLYWTQMTDVQLTYNGEVFNRFDSGSSVLWNIVEDQKSAAVSGLAVQNAGTTGVVTPQPVQYYVKLDFAQVSVPAERESVLIHGKPILNAIVQLTFTAPAAGVLHAMYLYNASLLCSRGSAEYIF